MNKSHPAKQTSIIDFLAKYNHLPSKTYGDFYWYKAPYRKDENPSFKVKASSNQWFDVALGSGGNIIDLVILMFNVNIAEAYRILGNSGAKSFSFSVQKPHNGIIVKHVQPIQNNILIEYLAKRKISHSTALKFLKEAYYTAENKPGKQYFALAFANDAGGYELRNSYWKGCSSKDITTIPGGEGAVNVFEGFFDFLAAYQYHSPIKKMNKTIVLNSTANVNRAIKAMEGAQRINLYLDNDAPGDEAAESIINYYPFAKKRNYIYQSSKDFAEFWEQSHKVTTI